MRKKILRMLGILSAVMLLAGCTQIGNTRPTSEVSDGTNPLAVEEPTKVSGDSVNLTEGRTGVDAEEALPTDAETASLSDASLALFEEVMAEKEGENVLLSPISIDFALGMTENGAAGDTLSQMENIVNGGIKIDQLNPLMKHLSNRFMNADDVKWNIANSIWFKNDGKFAMKDHFLDQAVGFYNADVFLAPFDEQTLADINLWVNDETNGMIPEILDSIHPNAKMYLVNAIAFEGEWMEQYEDDKIYEDREFSNLDGSTSKITMMGSKENRYFTIADGQGFVKPYKGGEYSFVGILPAENESPEELIAKINNSKIDFAKTVREADYTEVTVQIPEFTNDFGIELNDTYIELGMDNPFDPAQANFHEMMETTDGSPAAIWIGRILHKTHIEVDRKGTKAAAATVVEMRTKNAVMMDESKYVILNRPFVYAIVENETGLPVFIGCQNSMK